MQGILAAAPGVPGPQKIIAMAPGSGAAKIIAMAPGVPGPPGSGAARGLEVGAKIIAMAPGKFGPWLWSGAEGALRHKHTGRNSPPGALDSGGSAGVQAEPNFHLVNA